MGTPQYSLKSCRISSSVALKGKFPMKSLLGSMKDLVPGRPAVERRSLLSSIRWEDLEERLRLDLEDTFMVSDAAADDDWWWCSNVVW